MNTRLITDIEIDGIDLKDRPDFCDAYICYAVWSDTGVELTDAELEQATVTYSDYINEYCNEVNDG